MLSVSLLETAVSLGFKPDPETAVRVQLLGLSDIIACGIAEWTYSSEGCDRITEQAKGNGLIRFPDNSELYEQLMDDLDDFEMTQEEPLDKAFYVYRLSADRELSFTTFFRNLQPVH